MKHYDIITPSVLSERLYMEKIKKDAIKYKNLIPVAIVGLFLAIFAFNLISFNHSEKLESGTTDDNVLIVADLQQGDIDALEQEISRLDAKDKLSNSKSTKAMYKRLFKDSVVIGDSVTEGLKVYGWLNKKQVYSVVGASVASTKDLFKKAAKKKPKNVFLAFGMNDLIRYRNDSDGFIEEYRKRINEFKKKSPDTNIYVCSISTPDKSAINNQKSLGKYKKFNKKIEKMCEEDGYTYIPVADILANNKKLYAGDGIHATTDYYPHWLNRMAEYANLTN